jgi:uncharacterized membrane protein YkvA (DUF1232 family)
MLRLLRLWRLSARDLRFLWFALRHPNRPVWLLPTAALLGVYALDPLNLAMPVVGLVDELVLLPLMLHALAKFIPTDIRSGYEQRSFARG